MSGSILALEERGHTLFGLWTDEPHWYNTVGPLPFGHVRDLARRDWRRAVARARPDLIYALLNWQAVPLAHEVLSARTGIPFVWHFKEGPFICLEKGTWRQLLDLHERPDGRIYTSPEMAAWYDTVAPHSAGRVPTLVLDGDLPKADWFVPEWSPRLSDADGEVHTVVPGRPIGLHPHNVAELAAARVHLHFYGDFTHGQWRTWIDKARGVAGDRLHLHANVDQDRWAAEFSRYDAGWLHFFAARNGGDLHRADWDDLNIPARMATLACAGLPMLMAENTGHAVAIQSLADRLGVGLRAPDIPALAARLHDRGELDRLRANARGVRGEFAFDTHADRLIAFFREVIARHGRG